MYIVLNIDFIQRARASPVLFIKIGIKSIAFWRQSNSFDSDERSDPSNSGYFGYQLGKTN